MKLTALLALPLFTAAGLIDLDDPTVDVAAKWAQWKQQFNREYDAAADAVAFAKFEATDKKINAHNAAGDSYIMGHNQFSAMTPQEFKDQIVGHADMRRKGPFDFANFTSMPTVGANESLDWTEKGAVTPVKDQAQCGGCWAFSTVGAMEGAFQIAGNPLTSLSEQELVSCENKYHGGQDQGCNGGLMDNAFTWLASEKSKGGLCSEASYPYTSGAGQTGQCKGGVQGPTCKAVATCTGHKDVQTEADLLQALAIGPVSVAIEADKSIFQNYKAGVIGAAGHNLCGKKLDHGVLAVGYGTASQLKKYPGDHPYWRIKNSWGTTYGEKGFVRISRNINECGIKDGPPSYPTGVKPAV